MKKKWSVIVAVAVVIAGGAFLGYRIYAKLGGGGQPHRGRADQAVPVEVASVRRTALREVGLFTGSLAPESHFAIAPRVSGRLEKLLVNLGDPVRRGQLVAELDDDEYVQQLQRAKAELLVAQATVQECQSNLQAAQRDLERAETLRQKRIASEAEYDQARTEHEVQDARCRLAAAQVDQKQAALNEAQIRLSYTKIAADWEGPPDIRYVGERFVDQGALLTANAPIVSVLDISTLTAVIYVIERDYTRIAIGQEASVATDAFPGRSFAGRIVRIAPQLQETSRQARVELTVPNPQGLLKPGMFVRVELELARRDDAAAIPVAALARREGRQGVFVVDAAAKTARFVPVELGISSGELVEVLRPQLDAPVVVMGHHLLEDGSAVIVAEASATTATAPAAVGRTGASSAGRGRGRQP